MTILTFPSIRRPSSMSWALKAPTQTHVSPFNGATQTLRLPAERWAASVSWPTLSDPDRRVLEAFVAQLGGRAGRFYYGPTHAPRRATGTGRERTNWLSNSEWVGAAINVVPTDWTILVQAAGITVSVSNVGSDANGQWIDLTCTGTPTDQTFLYQLRTTSAGTGPVGVGGVATAAVTMQTIGAVTNVGTLRVGAHEVNSAGTYVSGSTWSTGTVAPLTTPTRRAATRSGFSNPRAGISIQAIATAINTAVNVTLRLWQPQLEPGSVATAYIATTTGAVTVSDPVVIDGGNQSGATLATRQWQPSVTAMLPGDFLSYVDTSGRARLHVCTGVVMSTASGQATIPVAPPLRRAGADGAIVELAAPVGVFRLTEDEVEVATRPPMFGSVTLTMEEALT